MQKHIQKQRNNSLELIKENFIYVGSGYYNMHEKKAMIKTLMLAAASLFVFSFAYADWSFNFYSNDYYFELYNGGKYIYTTTPYSYITYVSNTPYYYFDYPFRLYSYGSYYYFEPGWYSFGFSTMAKAPDVIYSTYAIAPDIALINYYDVYHGVYLYYTYYPASYYYYQSSWVYYPSWVGVYGPAYYGSFYYPPQTSLVGQTYQPKKEAFCSDFYFNAYDISVEAGNTYEVVFGLVNSSPMDLDVHAVQVFSNNVDLEVKEIEFDNSVKANGQGVVSFLVSSPFDAAAKNVLLELSINGTFKDGTYCNQSNTKQSVTVQLVPRQVTKQWKDSSIKYVSESSSNTGFSGSTHYFRQKTEETTISNLENYESKIMANARLAGNYQGNDSYQSAPSCNSLSLQAENFVLSSGSEKTTFATLSNHASDDFYIQKIEVDEKSPYFQAEAWRDSKKVFAGQDGAIKVKASALDSESTLNETAFLKVTGVFGSGIECSVSKYFTITVAGDKQKNKEFSLVLANEEKTDGFLTFGFENNSEESATIEVSSNDFMVSPKKFMIEAKTKGERTLAINGNTKTGKIFFKVLQGNERLFEKFVIIEKEESKAQIQQEAEATKEREESKANALPESTGFALTGLFSIINENALLLGFVLLFVFGVAFVLTRKTQSRVVV